MLNKLSFNLMNELNESESDSIKIKKTRLIESNGIKTIEEAVDNLKEKSNFDKLSKKILDKGKPDGMTKKSADAIAASIGRKKYGKEKFQKMAQNGKKLKENDNNEIINPDDKDYYDGKLWEVGLYPGAGYQLNIFKVYSSSAQEALDKVVAYAENSNPNLLTPVDEMTEFINNTYSDELEEYKENNPDATELEFATDYLGQIYIDATMEGASEPYFIDGTTLVINELNNTDESCKEIKEEVEYISKEEFDKIPDDYKSTVGETIKLAKARGEDENQTRKLYTDLGYEDTDPMILTNDGKGGTSLKPVKIKTNEADSTEIEKAKQDSIDKGLYSEAESKTVKVSFYVDTDQTSVDQIKSKLEQALKNTGLASTKEDIEITDVLDENESQKRSNLEKARDYDVLINSLPDDFLDNMETVLSNYNSDVNPDDIDAYMVKDIISWNEGEISTEDLISEFKSNFKESSNENDKLEFSNLVETKSQGNITMLESDGKYIVGENYNKEKNEIDNAEIYNTKEEADQDYLNRCEIIKNNKSLEDGQDYIPATDTVDK